MEKVFEAVYENGVFRPVEPLEMEEGRHVVIRLSSGYVMRGIAFVDPNEFELEDGEDVPTLEEVHAALSKDKSSWAEAIVAERESGY